MDDAILRGFNNNNAILSRLLDRLRDKQRKGAKGQGDTDKISPGGKSSKDPKSPFTLLHKPQRDPSQPKKATISPSTTNPPIKSTGMEKSEIINIEGNTHRKDNESMAPMKNRIGGLIKYCK